MDNLSAIENINDENFNKLRESYAAYSKRNVSKENGRYQPYIMTPEEQKKFIMDQIGVDPIVKAYRVLVRSPVIKERTKGGIILPELSRLQDQLHANFGLVLKIGETAFTHPHLAALRVEVGEWITYARYEREEVEYLHNSNCFYINDERVLCSYTPEDAQRILEKRNKDAT